MNERKVALVTNASYGIGQACALGLARDGFDVAVSDLRTDSLADTRARIEVPYLVTFFGRTPCTP